ncbi:hypothetical protein SLA2020_446470 [Shorea laevis]
MAELIIHLYTNLGDYLSFSPSSFLKNTIFYNPPKKEHNFGSWHELQDGLMENIFRRLNLIDRVRFGGVCKSWRSLVMQKHVRAAPQPPWLLLPHGRNCKSLSFFSICEGVVYDIKVAEAAKGGWCIGSSRGWLIMASGTEYEPEVFLFNPFSGVRHNLPSLTTIFPSFFDYVDAARDPQRFASFIDKIEVLSSDPSECIVAATFSRSKVLAFCKPGDKEWSVWEGINDQQRHYYLDIIFCEDTLCALVGMEEVEGGFESYTTCMKLGNREVMVKVIPHIVHVFDHAINDDFEIGDQDSGFVEEEGSKFNLVESDGELLMVVNVVDVHFTEFGESEEEDEDDEEEGWGWGPVLWEFVYYKTRTFEVFKIGTVPFTRVRSVGDKMLFVSQGESLSVSAADFKGFSGNLIYFLEHNDYSFEDFDPKVSRESGVFYLDDERIERSFPSTLPKQCRMCWLTPHPWLDEKLNV